MLVKNLLILLVISFVSTLRICCFWNVQNEVSLISKYHVVKTWVRNRNKAQQILSLGTASRQVFKSMLRPLYPASKFLTVSKVKLPLWLIDEAHCHEEMWGCEGIVPSILDFGTRLRWVVWMSPRVGLDVVGKRRILTCRKSNSDPSARSTSHYRLNYSDPQISGGTII
jgi:hypothetical protein